MKRKSSRRRRAAAAFFSDNRRLFPFVGLYLLGAVIGTAVYVTADESTAGLLRALVTQTAVGSGLRGILHALCGSCFSLIALLCTQFLLGLWPCGAPFVLLLPVLQGTATGISEAALYAEGGRGVLIAAVTVLPSALLSAALLAMAGAESLRLGTLLCRTLLPALPARAGDAPDSAPGGALRQPFRLYCLRYALFALGAVGVGLIDVLLRMALPSSLK